MASRIRAARPATAWCLRLRRDKDVSRPEGFLEVIHAAGRIFISSGHRLICTALFPIRIASIAAPAPLPGLLNQLALDRVAMHVDQLLDPFARAPNVEVVEAALPDALAGCRPELGLQPVSFFPQHATRKALLPHLHDGRRRASFRLAKQQGKGLGHHHVTGDYETVTLSRFLENLQEQIASRCAGEPGLAMITTTGKEMQMVLPVVALETLRHLLTVK